MNLNRYLAVSAAFLFLAGCAGKEPPPSTRLIDHQENLKTEPNRARLIVEPGAKVAGKANDVKVSEVRTQTLNGRMVVDFQLYNDRGRRDVVNYRVRWLDPNGMTVSNYDPWETVALEGHEQSVLSVTAPTAAATDFRLELKPNQ